MLESDMTVQLDERMTEQLQAAGHEQRDLDPVAPLAVAVELYRRRWLSLGLAAELAEMERHEFVLELADRDVPVLNIADEQVREELDRMKSMVGSKEKP
jgi:predicted HTH domain antitoxin